GLPPPSSATGLRTRHLRGGENARPEGAGATGGGGSPPSPHGAATGEVCRGAFVHDAVAVGVHLENQGVARRCVQSSSPAVLDSVVGAVADLDGSARCVHGQGGSCIADAQDLVLVDPEDVGGQGRSSDCHATDHRDRCCRCCCCHLLEEVHRAPLGLQI